MHGRRVQSLVAVCVCLCIGWRDVLGVQKGAVGRCMAEHASWLRVSATTATRRRPADSRNVPTVSGVHVFLPRACQGRQTWKVAGSTQDGRRWARAPRLPPPPRPPSICRPSAGSHHSHPPCPHLHHERGRRCEQRQFAAQLRRTPPPYRWWCAGDGISAPATLSGGTPAATMERDSRTEAGAWPIAFGGTTFPAVTAWTGVPF